MNAISLDVIVIGSGGLAREFSSYFSEYCNIKGYITNSPDDLSTYQLEGNLFPHDLTPDNSPTSNLVIAIGNPKTRRLLYEDYASRGFIFPRLIHPSSIVSNSSSLEDGVIVSPFVIIGPNCRIGKLVYCNYQVGIGHDCIVGSFTQINPGVQLGGNVFVCSLSLLGSNSTFLQSSRLNQQITVGSGSVILGTKNKPGTILPAFSKYAPF